MAVKIDFKFLSLSKTIMKNNMKNKQKYIYITEWQLYTRNQHNIVDQLYLNNFKK